MIDHKPTIKILSIIIRPLLLVITIVLIWEGIRVTGLFDKELLPNSISIFKTLIHSIKGQKFWDDLIATLYRSISGLSIALIIGVPIGLLIGSNRFLSPTGIPLIDFLRSIPVTTLYPVFVLTLGIGDKGKIGMIFLGCSLIILLHSVTGFEQRSRIRHQVSKLYGASTLYLLFKVSFFEALPSIMTGIRVAVGIALIISTLTEMFMGADHGMGQSLMEYYSIYNLSGMYAYIFALGLVGYLLNRVCVKCENYTKQWRTR